MSTTMPPLTKEFLAALERHCTMQEWPTHDWEPIAWQGATVMVCRQCEAEAGPTAVAENAGWLPPRCIHEAEPLDPSSALRLIAEIRRLRSAGKEGWE